MTSAGESVLLRIIANMSHIPHVSARKNWQRKTLEMPIPQAYCAFYDRN
jgi:hypothetical protein